MEPGIITTYPASDYTPSDGVQLICIAELSHNNYRQARKEGRVVRIHLLKDIETRPEHFVKTET